MREKLLINDIHLGVQRVAGTTQSSAQQLQEYLLSSLEKMLFEHPDKDAVINGDLFDAFMVSMLTILGFYGVARGWLIATAAGKNWAKGAEPKMTVGRGNHDWSKDSAKLSAFDFVCRLLATEFPDRFEAVVEPGWIDDKALIYMIPHMPNQDLFDLELERAEELALGRPGLLLLHANYDNGYTLESDHSLNVSEEQAKKLLAAGWTLVFGHEHQARCLLDERVIITGNQWPSSVADCLNNPGGKKYAHIIDAELNLTQVETWNAAADFKELDWRSLDMSDNTTAFVRVVGEATAEEAPQVIDAISKYRKDCSAFVVTNAVAIAGVREMADLPATMENIKAFDVLGFLFEQLEPAQVAVVKKLLAEAPERLKEAA